MTRRDYDHHEKEIDSDIKKKIQSHFLAAECSDWFWWYGDDHITDFGVEFDELFRSHLIEIYLLMKISPPNDLYTPIISDRSGENFHLQPKAPIKPSINGRQNTFFEWVGSGIVDETKLFSTMDRVRGPVEAIRYGHRKGRIYCAFEGDMSEMQKCDMIHVIIEPYNTRFEIPISRLCSTKYSTAESHQIKLEIACDTWLELGIDFRAVDAGEVQLRFEIERDSIIIQTLPGYGELEINLQTNYAENWFI